MNVKKAFSCMLTLLLVFAFFGCDQVFNPGDSDDTGIVPPPPIDGGTKPGTGENPDDTWTEITSLAGLEGTWLAKGIGTEKDSTTGELRSSPLYVSITYPFSGRNGKGVKIKDGVRVRMIDGLAVEDYIMVPSDFFNFVQKPGFLFMEIPECDSSSVKVNQSKTELKTEVVIVAPETIQTKEDWEKINQEGPSLSGDMFLSFVEGSPCTITGTVIFHKVDANTNIGTEPGTGENPDDTWTKITSFDGLEGTWESYAKNTVAVPVSDTDTVSSTCITETKYTIPYSGDVSRTMITDYTEYVKASAKYQGKEEQLVWQEFKDNQRPEEDTNGNSITFSEKAPYTMTYTYSESREQAEKEFTSGFIAINQLKTRIKINIVDSNPCISSPDDESQNPVKNDEEWKKFQEEYVKKHGVFSGDMKTTFSAGAPYTVTTTQILHKQ